MDLKKLEAECSKETPQQEKKNLECLRIFQSIPKAELKQLVRLGVPPTHERTPLKVLIKKWLSPTPPSNKPVFKHCSHDPPCNLECLYGKYHGPEEESDDVVKERILTKGGAVYDTIAYRLPENFAQEPICATLEQRLAARQAAELSEQPWYQTKKKKKKKPEMMEFTGPVKILVVDKEGFFTSYTAKRIHAGFIQISHMLIGAPIMCLFFYVLQFNTHYSTNLHILLCTIAFHYCLPVSILVRNKLCVAGYLMSSKHQYLHSMIFKSIAIILIIVCGYILQRWRPLLPRIFTKHAIVGYAACGFTITEYILNILMTLLMGQDRGFIIDCYLHILTMVAIVTSLMSLYLIMSAAPYKFKYFIPFMHWHYWILSIIGLFTLTAVFRPCMDCLYHLYGYVYATGKWVYRFFRPHDPCTLRKKNIENPFNLAKPMTDEMKKLQDLITKTKTDKTDKKKKGKSNIKKS